MSDVDKLVIQINDKIKKNIFRIDFSSVITFENKNMIKIIN